MPARIRSRASSPRSRWSPSPGRGRGAGTSEEAEAFYQRGHALYDQGKLAEASAALARSQALSPNMATVALLAACDEKRGLLARAHAEYLDAARFAGSLFDKREVLLREAARTRSRRACRAW